MNKSEHVRWPVLKHYDQKHLRRIAMPLGGIGTGTVSLGGRGDLRNWEIVNRPAKGFAPGVAGYVGPFFAIRVQPQGGIAVTRALEGPIDEADYEGSSEMFTGGYGLPKFRHCSFAAAYPLGQVLLDDPEVPVSVRLEAFNPLIPGDTDSSSIPMAVLRYVLVNPTGKPVAASICGTIPNFIGSDGSNSDFKGNHNEFRSSRRVQGLFLCSRELDPDSERWGTIALTTVGVRKEALSHRTAWAQKTWGDSLLDFWDDFSADGRVEEREQGTTQNPNATLAVSVSIPPHSSRSITFLLTWHFPNRLTWTPKPAEATPSCTTGSPCNCAAGKNPDWVGNYYTTRYRDAWEVAEKTAPRLATLEQQTVDFVDAFCAGDLPPVVKEAALFNVSTLRTQTVFRTADGMIYGWEGCCDRQGCCHGSCTHVWNYETAVGFLFGDLARLSRCVEFLHATDDEGRMSFRVNLPLDRAQEFGIAAADGQLGCIMRAYREWNLSGDTDFLRRLWPKIRKAVEFCWVPGGWDADRDGVIEGCQHNTMDVEYYGPNGQMGIWYLGALRAAEEMARHLGETAFADTCRSLFNRGSGWIDTHLFNGEYYEHRIQAPSEGAAVAKGLRGAGVKNVPDPDFQLGPACLVDQLVGQYMAHVTGLGYLTDPAHVKKALHSVKKYNFRKEFFSHFNHLRTFVLNDEQAILMATYPRGNRPRSPFPYCNEVMSGFEYTAATGMLYEGLIREGLQCIQAIRRRHDGWKRNPFDEIECGHHYARALASWSAVLALTGFQYSGVTRHLKFAARPGRHFWSNGEAWGTCRIQIRKATASVQLKVLHGTLLVSRFELTGFKEVCTGANNRVKAGQSLALRLRWNSP